MRTQARQVRASKALALKVLALKVLAWSAVLGAAASAPAFAQQKTGPGITGDDSLTWRGITLYGVIDLGVQYDTHGAPFTSYRNAGNIIRSNGHESVVGLTPSNMGQSRVGLQGNEPLNTEWSAVFQLETFFDPQSGQIVDSLKSLTANNGKSLAMQRVGVDGSSAGQAFQTAYVGLKSTLFGTLTVGRQVTLLSEGTIKYDPNYSATAFGLLGASNTYSGGGTSEDNRLDSTVIYSVGFKGLMHAAALYKTNDANRGSDKAIQANIGADYAGASIDAYYSKIDSAISATTLSTAQVTALPGLGYTSSNSLAATLSDNTTYSLMALYAFTPFKVFAGYLHIKYANPAHPLSAGATGIGGYVLALVNDTAYTFAKTNDLYWTGVRYALRPALELTAAYYGVRQNAYGTGTQAGCASTAHATCSGTLQAISLDADYHFTRRFDGYLGVMYSAVHDGVASGYRYSTNLNPTLGVRFKF